MADPLFVRWMRLANNPTTYTSATMVRDTSLDQTARTFLHAWDVYQFVRARTIRISAPSREVELNGPPVGQRHGVFWYFSGTFNPTYGNPFPCGLHRPDRLGLGLILTANGSNAKIYWDNIRIGPARTGTRHRWLWLVIEFPALVLRRSPATESRLIRSLKISNARPLGCFGSEAVFFLRSRQVVGDEAVDG